ncbi:hypothetical protein IU501_15590 [Nocardia otitidiscaviarum]|uniref:Uncharacterized protein n=1 Tax=Nocardia otitidiscaviarum TaxID=1823 RepID=A0A379JJV5_9NOCA|nr:MULTISPECIES: hypothetical protein [Nocardia]MBF6134421.1 hypothetical protein [Nocardia otitidiscaviarum]MBF6176936.1 hypothetical protein [Nocardia otitidiscaviarum]MBF6239707.1 hypothetical protein [Nocardia otitidiscaviarum]MBF6485953.1 hypothetical protein [Nocardia otitidiscaviarum]MCP9619655.1 hypothetical protein [Nocardia otitidiscaviarum]
MGTKNIQTGRHRLGLAGTVHCIEIPAVAAALAEHRRSWLTMLISPARHSFAAMRKRSAEAAAHWVPATAS